MVWAGNIHDVGRGEPPGESGSPQSLGGDSSASWLPQIDNQNSPILSPWRPEFTYLQLANEVPECGYDDMQLFANESQGQTGLNDGSNFGTTGSEDVTGSGEVPFVEKDPRTQIDGQIAEEAPYSSLNTDTVQIHKMPSGHGPTVEEVAVSSERKTPGELLQEGQPCSAVPAKSRQGKGKVLGVSQNPQVNDAPQVTKGQREQQEESLRIAQKKAEEEDKKRNVPPGSFSVFLIDAHIHMPQQSKDEQQNRDEATKGGRACCLRYHWRLK
ncbi:hypothetical protein CC79DRAFT_1393981, partial [Sarocladium strictum]